MTKSGSIQTYPHCKEIWDRAYASPSGTILIEHGDKMSASDQATLVGDLLHYRVLIRRDNCQFYPPGHPQHMTSIYDPFIVSKVNHNGRLYVRIRKRNPAMFKIIEVDDDATI